MKGDSLQKLGLGLVAVAVIFSVAATEIRAHRSDGEAAPVSWTTLALVGILGFVGRRWLVERGKTKTGRVVKPWTRRRPALPPPPDPEDRPREP